MQDLSLTRLFPGNVNYRPKMSEPQAFDILKLKLLGYSWNLRSSGGQHPADTADEIWQWLAAHRPVGKRPTKLMKGNSGHASRIVFEDVLYALVQVVPGSSPGDAWERHRERLLKLGIESKSELIKICKYSRQRSSAT